MNLNDTVYMFQPSYDELCKSVMYVGTITRIYKEVTEQGEFEVAYDIYVEHCGTWNRVEADAFSASKREAINRIKEELLKEEDELNENRKRLHFKLMSCDMELDKLEDRE